MKIQSDKVYVVEGKWILRLLLSIHESHKEIEKVINLMIMNLEEIPDE